MNVSATKIVESKQSWESICQLEDLAECIGVRALLGPHQVALFKVGSTVYAIGAYDPFSGAAVLSRGIVGDIGGELVVASPIYKHHFSLRTGRCVENPTMGVPVYEARIENNTVELAY